MSETTAGPTPAPSAPAPAEIVPASTRTVACDGDGDPSGHPRVYLRMGDRSQVDCPYCGRRFVLADAAVRE